MDPKAKLQEAVNSINLRTLADEVTDLIAARLRPAIQKLVDEAMQPSIAAPEGAPANAP